MSTHSVTQVTIRCDGNRVQPCGEMCDGSDDETALSIREWLAAHGWDISDDGDYCPAHKGIAMSIRGRRALERAEATLSSLRVKEER